MGGVPRSVAQDEMKALQRLNTFYFLLGYLGFLTTWILDTISSFVHSASLAAWNSGLQRGLRALSPHYCLARGLFEARAEHAERPGAGRQIARLAAAEPRARAVAAQLPGQGAC
jgi:hypothetical protein